MVVLIAENITIDSQIADMIIKLDVIIVLNTVIKVVCVMSTMTIRMGAKKDVPTRQMENCQAKENS